MNARMRYWLDLVLVMTRKDLKVRYQNNLLGYFWSIAHPLALAAVYYFAFKVIVRIPMEAFALFLIIGVFPWQWTSNSVSVASTVFLSNSSIIKKVAFPRSVLPLSGVLQDMLHYILSLPVIWLFIAIFHKPASPAWIYGIPVLLGVQFFLTYGLALLVSSINLFFRDLERLVTILLTLAFYVTPIIYPLEMVPVKFRWLIYANPFAGMIIGWQKLFLEGYLALDWLGISLAYAALSYALGRWVYGRLNWRFAEVL
ncbi:MAG: ABC transporter permease [candidate division FCPU426 bacterium]